MILVNRRTLFLTVAITISACTYFLISEEDKLETFPSYYTSTLKEKTGLHISITSREYVCINCVDGNGIGNEMFQFASGYGIARQKNMIVAIPETCKLQNIFRLSAFVLINTSVCSHFQTLRQLNIGFYDRKIVEFSNNTNVSIIGFLQSYRYFEKYESDIRNAFSFKDITKTKADTIFNDILYKNNLTCLRIHQSTLVTRNNYIQCTKGPKFNVVTIVGIHVRRGDWLDPHYAELGFQTASKEYLQKAVNWYKERYAEILFIVASNGMVWTKLNLPENISVEYLEGNAPEIDIAILTSCNQFISTTGTFGWWIGWLIGGNVTYYKWPARENTPFRNSFGKYYSDYYCPWWIGL